MTEGGACQPGGGGAVQAEVAGMLLPLLFMQPHGPDREAVTNVGGGALSPIKRQHCLPQWFG